MRWIRLSLLGWISLLAVASAVPGRAADCSSSVGCTKCLDEGQGFKCVFTQESASCECEVFIFGGTPACGEDGSCDYDAPSGGGGGGGTEPTDPACVRVPGQWCPAECSACQTVFWY